MAHQLPLPETPEQRKARQFATLHHLGTLGHDLACDAHARAKEQLAPPQHQRPKHPIDYANTFATLSRAVRQAIALEHRLDAPARTRPAYRDAAPLPDPRRTLLRQVFHDAVRKQPDGRRRFPEIDDRIDTLLAADPPLSLDEIVVDLCNTLHIDLDLSKVPDELLGMPPRRRPYPTPS